MTNTYTSKRDPYWDSLKFILIALVVIGHIIEIGKHYNQSLHICTLYHFIYTFHMPLFLFVSGIFTRVKDKKKYVKGLLQIFETYIIFQIIFSFDDLIRGDFSVSKVLFRPNYWYLMTLIIYRIFVLLTHSLLDKKSVRNIIIPLSFFLSFVAGYFPLEEFFSFQRTFSFLPFFLLGYYSDFNTIKNTILRLSPITCVIFLLGLYIFLYTTGFQAAGYFPKAYNHHFTIYNRILLTILSLISIGAFMRITINLKLNVFLAYWGQFTLSIYIYQNFTRKPIASILSHGFLNSDLLTLLLISFVIILTITFASTSKILKFTLNPISKIIILCKPNRENRTDNL